MAVAKSALVMNILVCAVEFTHGLYSAPVAPPFVYTMCQFWDGQCCKLANVKWPSPGVYLVVEYVFHGWFLMDINM